MKKILWIIGLLSAAAIGSIGFLTVNTRKKAVSEFPTSGYILDTDETGGTVEMQQYYFNAGEDYSANSALNTISFKTVEGSRVSVRKESYIHYNDSSMEAMTRTVIFDTDESDAAALSYYAIPKTTKLVRGGDCYTVSTDGYEKDFRNFVWKISDTDYMVVSDEVRLVISEGEEVSFPDYVQVRYQDSGVVYLTTQQGVYSTVSSDAYLELSNGIRIYLGSKNVSTDEGIVMNLGQMTVNSEDSVELAPDEEYKNENTTQPQLIVDASDGEDGEPGKDGDEGDAGEAGTNGAKGTAGDDGDDGDDGDEGDAGEAGKAGASGTSGKNGENGGTGATGGGGSAGEEGDPGTPGSDASTANISFSEEAVPTFWATILTSTGISSIDLEEEDSTCDKVVVKYKYEDSEDMPVDADSILLSIVESDTGSVVSSVAAKSAATLKDGFYRVEFSGLQPSTNYQLVITATYQDSNGNSTEKDVLDKYFVTESLGVALSKRYVTENSVDMFLTRTSSDPVAEVIIELYDEKKVKLEATSDVTFLIPKEGLPEEYEDNQDPDDPYVIYNSSTGLFDITSRLPIADTDSIQSIGSRMEVLAGTYKYDTETKTGAISMEGLTSNTVYYARIRAFEKKDGETTSTESSNSYPFVQFKTLKQKPVINAPIITATPYENTFTVNGQGVSDPDKGILSYRYELYEVIDHDAQGNPEYASAPTYSVDSSTMTSIKIQVGKNGVDKSKTYAARIVAVFDDNETSREYAGDFSSEISMQNMVWPSVDVKYENQYTASTVEGTVTVTDTGKMISRGSGEYIRVAVVPNSRLMDGHKDPVPSSDYDQTVWHTLEQFECGGTTVNALLDGTDSYEISFKKQGLESGVSYTIVVYASRVKRIDDTDEWDINAPLKKTSFSTPSYRELRMTAVDTEVENQKLGSSFAEYIVLSTGADTAEGLAAWQKEEAKKETSSGIVAAYGQESSGNLGHFSSKAMEYVRLELWAGKDSAKTKIGVLEVYAKDYQKYSYSTIQKYDPGYWWDWNKVTNNSFYYSPYLDGTTVKFKETVSAKSVRDLFYTEDKPETVTKLTGEGCEAGEIGFRIQPSSFIKVDTNGSKVEENGSFVAVSDADLSGTGETATIKAYVYDYTYFSKDTESCWAKEQNGSVLPCNPISVGSVDILLNATAPDFESISKKENFQKEELNKAAAWENRELYPGTTPSKKSNYEEYTTTYKQEIKDGTMPANLQKVWEDEDMKGTTKVGLVVKGYKTGLKPYAQAENGLIYTVYGGTYSGDLKVKIKVGTEIEEVALKDLSYGELAEKMTALSTEGYGEQNKITAAGETIEKAQKVIDDPDSMPEEIEQAKTEKAAAETEKAAAESRLTDIRGSINNIKTAMKTLIIANAGRTAVGTGDNESYTFFIDATKVKRGEIFYVKTEIVMNSVYTPVDAGTIYPTDFQIGAKDSKGNLTKMQGSLTDVTGDLYYAVCFDKQEPEIKLAEWSGLVGTDSTTVTYLLKLNDLDEALDAEDGYADYTKDYGKIRLYMDADPETDYTSATPVSDKSISAVDSTKEPEKVNDYLTRQIKDLNLGGRSDTLYLLYWKTEADKKKFKEGTDPERTQASTGICQLDTDNRNLMSGNTAKLVEGEGDLNPQGSTATDRNKLAEMLYGISELSKVTEFWSCNLTGEGILETSFWWYKDSADGEALRRVELTLDFYNDGDKAEEHIVKTVIREHTKTGVTDEYKVFGPQDVKSITTGQVTTTYYKGVVKIDLENDSQFSGSLEQIKAKNKMTVTLRAYYDDGHFGLLYANGGESSARRYALQESTVSSGSAKYVPVASASPTAYMENAMNTSANVVAYKKLVDGSYVKGVYVDYSGTYGDAKYKELGCTVDGLGYIPRQAAELKLSKNNGNILKNVIPTYKTSPVTGCTQTSFSLNYTPSTAGTLEDSDSGMIQIFWIRSDAATAATVENWTYEQAQAACGQNMLALYRKPDTTKDQLGYKETVSVSNLKSSSTYYFKVFGCQDVTEVEGGTQKATWVELTNAATQKKYFGITTESEITFDETKTVIKYIAGDGIGYVQDTDYTARKIAKTDKTAEITVYANGTSVEDIRTAIESVDLWVWQKKEGENDFTRIDTVGGVRKLKLRTKDGTQELKAELLEACEEARAAKASGFYYKIYVDWTPDISSPWEGTLMDASTDYRFDLMITYSGSSTPKTAVSKVSEEPEVWTISDIPIGTSVKDIGHIAENGYKNSYLNVVTSVQYDYSPENANVNKGEMSAKITGTDGMRLFRSLKADGSIDSVSKADYTVRLYYEPSAYNSTNVYYYGEVVVYDSKYYQCIRKNNTNGGTGSSLHKFEPSSTYVGTYWKEIDEDALEKLEGAQKILADGKYVILLRSIESATGTEASGFTSEYTEDKIFTQNINGTTVATVYSSSCTFMKLKAGVSYRVEVAVPWDNDNDGKVTNTKETREYYTLHTAKKTVPDEKFRFTSLALFPGTDSYALVSGENLTEVDYVWYMLKKDGVNEDAWHLVKGEAADEGQNQGDWKDAAEWKEDPSKPGLYRLTIRGMSSADTDYELYVKLYSGGPDGEMHQMIAQYSSSGN